jgi:hypothetical protein
MSVNGDEAMSDITSEIPYSPTWEPLPETISGVVAFFADKITTRINFMVAVSGEPTDLLAAVQKYVNEHDPALLPTPEYLAQREAISQLGLDPDILAPIRPIDLLVGNHMAYLTYPEDAIREWVMGVGWSEADCDTICSQLVFIDPAAVAYVATLTPGVQTINGNLVNIIL